MPPKTIKRSHLQPSRTDDNEINRIFQLYTSPSLLTTTISRNNNNNPSPSLTSAKTTTGLSINLSYDELLEQYIIFKEELEFLKNNSMPKPTGEARENLIKM